MYLKKNHNYHLLYISAILGKGKKIHRSQHSDNLALCNLKFWNFLQFLIHGDFMIFNLSEFVFQPDIWKIKGNGGLKRLNHHWWQRWGQNRLLLTPDLIQIMKMRTEPSGVKFKIFFLQIEPDICNISFILRVNG